MPANSPITATMLSRAVGLVSTRNEQNGKDALCQGSGCRRSGGEGWPSGRWWTMGDSLLVMKRKYYYQRDTADEEIYGGKSILNQNI